MQHWWHFSPRDSMWVSLDGTGLKIHVCLDVLCVTWFAAWHITSPIFNMHVLFVCHCQVWNEAASIAWKPDIHLVPLHIGFVSLWFVVVWIRICDLIFRHDGCAIFGIKQICVVGQMSLSNPIGQAQSVCFHIDSWWSAQCNNSLWTNIRAGSKETQGWKACCWIFMEGFIFGIAALCFCMIEMFLGGVAVWRKTEVNLLFFSKALAGLECEWVWLQCSYYFLSCNLNF